MVRNGLSPVWVALHQRCPHCGIGKLFTGILTVVDICPHCALDLRAQDSGDGPAVFIGFFFCLLITVAALAVEFTYEPSVWVHIALWPLLTVVGCVVMLRMAKAMLIAQQYRVHGTGLDDRPPNQ